MALQTRRRSSQRMQLFSRSPGHYSGSSPSLTSSPKLVLTKVPFDPKLVRLKHFRMDKYMTSDFSEFSESENESSLIVSFPLAKQLKRYLQKKSPRQLSKAKTRLKASPHKLRSSSKRRSPRPKRLASSPKPLVKVEDDTESSEVLESMEEPSRVSKRRSPRPKRLASYSKPLAKVEVDTESSEVLESMEEPSRVSKRRSPRPKRLASSPKPLVKVEDDTESSEVLESTEEPSRVSKSRSPRPKRLASYSKPLVKVEVDTESSEVLESTEELNQAFSSLESEIDEMFGDRDKTTTSESDDSDSNKQVISLRRRRVSSQSISDILNEGWEYHKKNEKLQQPPTKRSANRSAKKPTRRRIFDDSDDDSCNETTPGDTQAEKITCSTLMSGSCGVDPTDKQTDVVEVVLDDEDFGIVVDQPSIGDECYDTSFVTQSAVDSDVPSDPEPSESTKQVSRSKKVVRNKKVPDKKQVGRKQKVARNNKEEVTRKYKRRPSKVEVTASEKKTSKKKSNLVSKPIEDLVKSVRGKVSRRVTSKRANKESSPANTLKDNLEKVDKGEFKPVKVKEEPDDTVKKRKRGRPPKNKTTTRPQSSESDKNNLSLELHEAKNPRTGVDSGYPTSASSSDSNSSSSSVHNSRSPELMTPTLTFNEIDSELTLRDGQCQRGLILGHNDPILRDSNLNDGEFHAPELDPSSQVQLVFDPNNFNILQNLYANFTIDETQNRSSGMALHSSAAQQDQIYPELEMFLNPGVDPEQLLRPSNQIMIEKVESLNGGGQETVEAGEVDDILQSESVSKCLKELRQAGKIGGDDPPDSSLVNQETQSDSSAEGTSSNAEASTMQVVEPAHNKVMLSPPLPKPRVVYNVDALLATPIPGHDVAGSHQHQARADDDSTAKQGRETKKKKKKKRQIAKPKIKEEDSASSFSSSGSQDSVLWSSMDGSDGEKDKGKEPSPILPVSVTRITKSGRKLKPSWKVAAANSSPVATAKLSLKALCEDNSKTSAPTESFDNAELQTSVLSPIHVPDRSVEPTMTENSSSSVKMSMPASTKTPQFPKEDLQPAVKRKKIIVLNDGKKKKRVKIIGSIGEKSTESSNSLSSVTPCSLSNHDHSATSSELPVPISSKKVLCYLPSRGHLEVTLLECEVRLAKCDLSLVKKEGVKPQEEPKAELSKDKAQKLSKSKGVSRDEITKKRRIKTSKAANKTLPKSSSTVAQNRNSEPVVIETKPVVDSAVEDSFQEQPPVDNKASPISLSPLNAVPVMPEVTCKTLSSGTSGPTAKEKKTPVRASNSLSMSLDHILKEMGEDHLKTQQKPREMKKPQPLMDISYGLDYSSDLLENSSVLLASNSSLCPLPDLDSKVVNFREPLEHTPYNYDCGSLTSQEINDLILSPLAGDNDSSDDHELDEGLFAPPFIDDDLQPAMKSESDHEEERILDSKEIVKETLESIDEAETPCSSEADEAKKENEEIDEELEEISEPVPSPKVTKKLHISEGGDEEGEDCIDLFPEDGDDLFAHDTDEDPLAKVLPNFKKQVVKHNKPGSSSTNRPGTAKLSLPLPVDMDISDDDSIPPPVSMPYKKQQVSQWVANQALLPSGPPNGHGVHNYHPYGILSSRIGGPHKGLGFPLHPGPSGINQRGILGAYGDTSMSRPYPGTDSPPPPPPPPISPLMRTSSPVPSPFFATTLPSGTRSTQSSESGSVAVVVTPTLPTVGGGLGGYCKNFIRGFCNFNPCKYKHANRDSAPLSVVEEALFRLPLEKIPTDVVKRFSANFHSNSLLKNKFSTFVDLIRALLDRSFSQTVSHYRTLTKFGVKFSAPFLSQLLELCTFQTPSSTAQLSTVAEEFFNAIKLTRGHHSSEDYYTLLKVLVNTDAKKKALKAYNVMKFDGVEPTLDILFLILRLGKISFHSPFSLLDDIKLCHPKPVEEARIVNRIVDSSECLLLPKQHCVAMGKWVESSPNVADKLTYDSFNKLYQSFFSHKQWGFFVSLLNHCSVYLHELRSHVCAALVIAVKKVGATENMMSVIEKLSEEQKSGIDIQVWDTILTECSKKGKSQRTTKFYQWLAEKKKQLSPETFVSLMEMYLNQHSPSACLMVLREALKQSPPVIPPMTVLTPVCHMIEKAKDITDLMLIIRAQLTTNMNPPKSILDILFTIHSKEKIHSKIAEVVKLSCECGAILDKEFYQKSLIELRQWGRDQDALSAVYKALRKVEGLEDSFEGIVKDEPLLPFPPSKRSQRVQSPPPPPPPPPQPSIETTTTTRKASVPISAPESQQQRTESSSTSQSSNLMSIQGMLQQGSVHDMNNVSQLIEVNGTQGQLGTVAAILVSLQGTSSTYDSRTIHAVWKAVTSSPERAANAFSSLLSHLDQFRAAIVNAPMGRSLLTCDRWLVTQIGIALMKNCEESQDWQSGFVILHHLHRYGVHYVKFSQPHSTLPPLKTHPPSPCSVALMAVNMCLHIEQVTGALEVLRGCEWVKASSTSELEPRTEMLCSLAEKCLDAEMYRDAWECLEAVNSCTLLKKLFHRVTNLHNKLLKNVLVVKECNLALSVYYGMRSANLQCLPSIFSDMLQSLCDSNQVDLARDLCKAAIAGGSYGPLVQGSNLFKVFLPNGVARIELHLLLEHHLRRLAKEPWKNKDEPLYVQFGTGCRHILEQVFSEDFTPKLKAAFAGKIASSASIPASSLRQWFEGNGILSTSQLTSVGEASLSLDQKTTTTSVGLGRKRKLSSLSSDGDREDNKIEGAKEEEGSCMTKEQGQPPKKIIRLSSKEPCDGEKKPSSSQQSAPTTPLLSPKSSGLTNLQKAARKKQFREAVCRTFVDKLKPHYQAKKFKTPADYTHLLKRLSHNFFKKFKSFNSTVSTSPGIWDLKDSVRSEITEIVSKIMSQCTIYSEELDNELGLCVPES